VSASEILILDIQYDLAKTDLILPFFLRAIIIFSKGYTESITGRILLVEMKSVMTLNSVARPIVVL